MLTYSDLCYEYLKQIWESKRNLHLTSMVALLLFVGSTILSFLVITHNLDLGVFNEYFHNPFASIEIVFTLLLITELLGLIFTLPKSVAQSVSKQFELLSLIFLRDGFKEFSHITDFNWEHLQLPLLYMAIYGFGAIAIFIIIGLTNKLQKRFYLTDTEDGQAQFIRLKKLLSLFILIAFTIVGYYDVKTLVQTGIYLHSFKTFYTVLIFSDILIVLIALRYTFNYFKIFRYSAFVFATIMIRIALSTKPYYDVLIGLTAALYVLLLTFTYNYFLNELTKKNISYDH